MDRRLLATGVSVIRALTWLVTHSLFRSLQVTGLDPKAMDGPSLVVATHFGGFADPIMLLSVLPHTPRFLAKSTLWDAFWLAPILNLVRAIPVYRAEDGGTEANAATFTAATDALAKGHTVAIFPEGFANDDPGLHPLKTGAARLAIDGYAAGVRGIQIVPFCGQYERKTRMRTRAWVAQGASMSVDDAIPEIAVAQGGGPAGGVTSDDHEAVRMLNAKITALMESIAPTFPDEATAAALTASTAYMDDGSGPGFRRARAAACAQARGAAEPAAASDTDEAGPSRIAWRVIAIVVLAPIAMVGALLNLIPWGIVALGRALRDAPVKEATINVFVAPLVFPLAWLVWGIVGWSAYSFAIGPALLIGAPLAGAATCFWWRRLRESSR